MSYAKSLHVIRVTPTFALKGKICQIVKHLSLACQQFSKIPNVRMLVRIGINLGDIIHDEVRKYGDGINVAARLEGLAKPGGVIVSQSVTGLSRLRWLPTPSAGGLIRPSRALIVTSD